MPEVDIAAVLELRPDLLDDDADCPYRAQLCLVSRERIGDLETRLENRQLAAQDGRDLAGIGHNRGTAFHLDGCVVGRRDAEQGILFTDGLP